MWRDLRYAIRVLRRSPVLTAAATIAMGLAVAANATIFGLVDGLWFRPPGVRDAASLVRVFSVQGAERDGLWSFPDYADIRPTSAFSDVVARSRRGAIMRDATGAPDLLLANVVSINFFATLGVQPAYGRLFAPGDEPALDAQPGIVLGHAFWQRRFGSDPAIVGRTIDLDRAGPLPVTVLAVLPAAFRDLETAADRDIWLPPQTWARLAGRDEFERRGERIFDVIARLRPGTSVRAADSEVAALTSSLARMYPATHAGWTARVVSDRDFRIESGGVNALALLGLVLLVVAITCVNLANLLLARAAGRSQELAMCVAIGASRGRLARQVLIECAVLGAAGAAVGMLMAAWLIRLLPAILVQPPGFRSFVLFQADARVFAFSCAVAVLTTILFGLGPSWAAARTDVAPLIKSGAVPAGSGRIGRLLRNGLVVLQVAVSLVLLSAAGVLARSFVESRRGDIGISRAPVLTAWISSLDAPAPVAREGTRRIEALPGVKRVAVGLRSPLSLSGGGRSRRLVVQERPPDPAAGLPEVKYNSVSAGYFETLGITLVRGRVFDEADERGGEPVMIVSEAFERQFYGGSSALDRTVRVGGANGPAHRIVGVVRNAVINNIGEPTEPYFYLSYWREPQGEITYLVATSGPAADLAAEVRDVLKGTDPRLEPRRLITMAQYIEYSGGAYQATAVLSGALGTIGLLLTAIGLYGVVAYRTSRRTREIGIMVALGATRRDVMALVLAEGARLAALGVLIGLPMALTATRLISSMLFGTEPWDATTFGGAAALLCATLGVATFLPAWRASRLAPSLALRE